MHLRSVVYWPAPILKCQQHCSLLDDVGIR
jgi:hypothetical protein